MHLLRESQEFRYIRRPRFPKRDLGSIFHGDWSTVETCNLEYEYIEGGLVCYPGTRNAGVTRSWVTNTRNAEKRSPDARLRVRIQMRNAPTLPSPV